MIAIVAATLLGSFAVGQPPPSIELRWSAGVAPASLQRRRLGARSLSYSYMCEAGGPCATPEALAHDYFDGNVTLIATYYQVSSNATSGEATEHEVNSTSLDFSRPTQYEIKFNARDKAGNPAKQVVVSIIVHDSTKPEITLCTNFSNVFVEAAQKYTYCAPSASDNIDGNISTPCASTEARNCLETVLRDPLGVEHFLSPHVLQSVG